MAWLNETTIEGHSPAFDVGARRNFEQVRAAPQGPPSPGPAPEGNWPRCVRQVFGSDPRLWFLPVWGGGPAGDGVHWPSRRVVREPGSPSYDDASRDYEGQQMQGLTQNMTPEHRARRDEEADDTPFV